jgi:metallophosphoesterase superfamily enzyme
MKPDCLVYISSVGCRNTWGIIKMIQRVMESEGVPTLLVFGDVFDERVTSWKSISESMSEFMKIRRIGSWSSQDAMLGH